METVIDEMAPTPADLKLMIVSVRIRNAGYISVMKHIELFCPWIFRPYTRGKYLHRHKGKKPKRGLPWKRRLSRK